MPEINKVVIQSIFNKNALVAKDIERAYPALITKMCYRMRTILGFMQKEIRVYSQGDIESASSWKQFLDGESTKISAGKY